ncbi:MAG: hypothetical protein QXY41_05900 [Thermoproteota archaeon]
MIEAYRLARSICKVIVDDVKRAKCVHLIAKILIYGASVKDEVSSEINRVFTDEERLMLKKRIAEFLD